MVQANLDPTAWIVRTGVAYGGADAIMGTNKAMDNALTGDTILLSEGEFAENVLISVNGVTIKGQGPDKTIIRGYGINPAASKVNTCFRDLKIIGTITDHTVQFPSGVDDARYINVVIEGYTGKNAVIFYGPASNLYFKNVVVHGGLNGFSFNQGINIIDLTMDDVVIINPEENGIYFLQNSAAGKIKAILNNVRILGAGHYGIYLYGGVDIKARNLSLLYGTDATCGGLKLVTDAGAKALKLELIDSIIAHNAGYGVVIDEAFVSQSREIRNCAIFGNAVKDCKTNVAADMELNWWGKSPPTAGQFDGSVDYTPFLTKPTAEVHACTLSVSGMWNVIVKSPDKIERPALKGILKENITDVATSFKLKHPEIWPDVGIIKLDNEYISWESKSADTFTIKTRGLLGSTPAAHTAGIIGYQVNYYRVMTSVVDNDGAMTTPDSAPIITIKELLKDTTILTGAMTEVETGVYSKEFSIDQNDTHEVINFEVEVTNNGLTQKCNKTSDVYEAPLYQKGGATAILSQMLGEYIIDQDGWTDADGVLHEWNDDNEGYIRDSYGSRVDDVVVTAYRRIDSKTIRDPNPPFQIPSDVNGEWAGFLDAGSYEFTFYKDKKQFLKPVVRTVGS